MPTVTEWTEPDVALVHNGVTVYHTYKDDDVGQGKTDYRFTTDASSDDHHFDIRRLDVPSKDALKAHPPYLSTTDSRFAAASEAQREQWKREWEIWHDQGHQNAVLNILTEAIDSGLITNPKDAPDPDNSPNCFVRCDRSVLGMLQSFGAETSAYDPVRGGVDAFVVTSVKEQMEQFPADFQVTFNPPVLQSHGREKDYRITWEIDVSAESPSLAALNAWSLMRSATSTANVFQVSDGITSVQVDLEAEREQLEAQRSNVPFVMDVSEPKGPTPMAALIEFNKNLLNDKALAYATVRDVACDSEKNKLHWHCVSSTSAFDLVKCALAAHQIDSLFLHIENVQSYINVQRVADAFSYIERGMEQNGELDGSQFYLLCKELGFDGIDKTDKIFNLLEGVAIGKRFINGFSDRANSFYTKMEQDLPGSEEAQASSAKREAFLSAIRDHFIPQPIQQPVKKDAKLAKADLNESLNP